MADRQQRCSDVADRPTTRRPGTGMARKRVVLAALLTVRGLTDPEARLLDRRFIEGVALCHSPR